MKKGIGGQDTAGVRDLFFTYPMKLFLTPRTDAPTLPYDSGAKRCRTYPELCQIDSGKNVWAS